jgi:hypothetical protein
MDNKNENISTRKNNTPYMPFKGMLLMIVISSVIIVGSTVIFFVFGRPFTRFIHYECIILNKEWFIIDADHVKVVYYVDGVEYENILHISRGSGGGRTRASFYYNQADPTDVVNAAMSSCRIIGPIGIGLGLFIILISALQYRNFRKSEVRTVEQTKEGGKNNGRICRKDNQ